MTVAQRWAVKGRRDVEAEVSRGLTRIYWLGVAVGTVATLAATRRRRLSA